MTKNLWWTLILNNSHSIKNFSFEKKLRSFAKENALVIKKSYTSFRCFYTESLVYVPGN